jgi:hypothetical protein
MAPHIWGRHLLFVDLMDAQCPDGEKTEAILRRNREVVESNDKTVGSAHTWQGLASRARLRRYVTKV